MYNPFNNIIPEIAKKYAEWMISWFPTTKDDYSKYISRAKNVMTLIFNEYYVIPKTRLEDVVMNNENSDEIRTLTKVFGEHVIEDVYHRINDKH